MLRFREWLACEDTQSEMRAFLIATLRNTSDDTARLVFADWLDEHGMAGPAELLRHGSDGRGHRAEFTPVDGTLPNDATRRRIVTQVADFANGTPATVVNGNIVIARFGEQWAYNVENHQWYVRLPNADAFEAIDIEEVPTFALWCVLIRGLAIGQIASGRFLPA